MNGEPKLLSEAEWRKFLAGYQTQDMIDELRERGLIAEEPVDPVELVMRLIRDMSDDSVIEQAIRELAQPKLTREMVRKATIRAGILHLLMEDNEDDRRIASLHTALTEVLG